MKAFTDHISKPLRPAAKYLLLFAALITFYVGLLVLAALIPRSAIQKNLEASARYLCQRSVFFSIFQGDSSSTIDRYADSILLNIALNFDSEKPLESVMASSYYHTATANENFNLLTAVTESPQPTYDYLRYWHGSLVLIRPLLMLFDIQEIYIINAIILLLLSIIQLVFLKKRQNSKIFFSFLLGLVMISAWYVPLSLEYTWCFLIMYIVSIWACCGDFKKMPLVLFITGSVTAFMDFLTTETLTLLMPLTLLLLRAKKEGAVGSYSSGVRFLLSPCITWCLGYGGTILAKWTLASAVLQRNALAESLDYAANRVYGDAPNVSGILMSLLAPLRNCVSLFPFSLMGTAAVPVFFITLIVLFLFFYLFRNDRQDWYLTGLLLTIAALPLLRFFVLANHSYIHYFFTHRALLSSCFCVGFVFYNGLDTELMGKQFSKVRGIRSKRKKSKRR